jgi:hypothetical protein
MGGCVPLGHLVALVAGGLAARPVAPAGIALSSRALTSIDSGLVHGRCVCL